jgi:hypothetical protein
VVNLPVPEVATDPFPHLPPRIADAGFSSVLYWIQALWDGIEYVSFCTNTISEDGKRPSSAVGASFSSYPFVPP